MKRTTTGAVLGVLLGSACVWSAATGVRAQEPQPVAQALAISPALRELLREEMRGISSGVQALVPAIAAGDWKAIADTSAQIKASYIMEQKLTPAQKEELESALPEVFKLMDANFHREAGNLGRVAEARDAELTVFYFYRMVESCVACHSAYATTRFPNLAVGAAGEAHQHQ
jgi:hypothetical protein